MLHIRQRAGYLLLTVVVGHVIVISAQVNSKTGDSVLETVGFGAFAEVQRVLSRAAGGAREIWAGYVELRGVRMENEALQRQVADLELRLQHQRALAQRSRSLIGLLDLRERLDLPTIGARVIATDATPWFRTLTIDRGATDGLRSDLPVIAPDGVVGRVVGRPGPRAAKVQLLIDRNAAAGAMLERTRAAGLILGSEASDQDGLLRMEYVSNLEDVQRGDVVVTSGIDGIYPKGYIIGTIEVAERAAGLYKMIRVRPAVDFTALEDVLVVMMEAPPAPAESGAE